MEEYKMDCKLSEVTGDNIEDYSIEVNKASDKLLSMVGAVIKDEKDKAKMYKVLIVLNQMIKACEPFKYEDFNKVIKADSIAILRQLEADEPTIGIARFNKPDEGISTLSIIATITDILCGDRLGFVMDDEGFIAGVEWTKNKFE